MNLLAPIGLKSLAVTPTPTLNAYSMTLEWDAVPDAKQYVVYSACSWVDPADKYYSIARVSTNIWTGTQMGTNREFDGTTEYYITAVDENGNESPPSEKVCFRWGPGQEVPDRPRILN
jgi:fibronectin type 3 domain-containing protein